MPNLLEVKTRRGSTTVSYCVDGRGRSEEEEEREGRVEKSVPSYESGTNKKCERQTILSCLMAVKRLFIRLFSYPYPFFTEVSQLFKSGRSTKIMYVIMV